MAGVGQISNSGIDSQFVEALDLFFPDYFLCPCIKSIAHFTSLHSMGRCMIEV
jgi:hypothetical protein